jgi:hypothetical protein
MMMNNHKEHIRSLAQLAGIIALVLIATAFFHLCLHSIVDNEDADSNHHCLLCTVLSHTISFFNPSDFSPTPPITNRPLLLMPVFIELPSVQASILVRGPPRAFSSNLGIK